jgi:hypothetical protein
MKRIFSMALCAAAAAVLMTGCEWSTSSEYNESWNDSYNWVNFSGTYRHAGNGMLVTDYTIVPGTPEQAATEGWTNSTSSTASYTESGGVLAGGVLAASGSTRHLPVVPRSFFLTIGSDVVLWDNGEGALEGGDASGSVSYDGGNWAFKLKDSQWSEDARSITVQYACTTTQTTSQAGTAAVPATGATTNSGASGKAIYLFVVRQQGQNLTVTDNNGATYSGRILGLRSASGMASTNTLPVDGDTVVASFSVKGTSAAGKAVTITGTFQGTVSARAFTGRTMEGTWVEAGGKTGNISGTTGDIGISVATTTSDETTTSTSTSSTTSSSTSSSSSGSST